MNKEFRLGIVREAENLSVFDYADYSQIYAEPQGIGQRNWSLLEEINQKRQRLQDEPMSLPVFFYRWPQVRAQFLKVYGEREELQLIVASS